MATQKQKLKASQNIRELKKGLRTAGNLPALRGYRKVIKWSIKRQEEILNSPTEGPTPKRKPIKRRKKQPREMWISGGSGQGFKY